MSDSGILAFEFSATFNRNVILPLGIGKVGCIADTPAWTVLENILPGEMKIGGFGSNELNGSGVLLSLLFRVVGTIGAKSSITLNPFIFNSGSPVAVITNGSLVVQGPAVVKSVISPTVKSPTLEQNYPNPFNPNTIIRFNLPHRSNVSLTVFDALGHQVAALVKGEREAGSHAVRFDAGGLASGVYFYRLRVGRFSETHGMILSH